VTGPGEARPGGSAREVLLPGGVANKGRVVRLGETVRRPLRRTSPATHALLRHLADVGFSGAPRLLGTDARGREVLGYIPGTTVIPPYPDWAFTDEALASVAELLGEYHRAVAGFDPTPYDWPESPPGPFAGELVSHNDPNLDNVVFRDGRAVALIDFDLASPGSRLWDVACAARQWAPLRPDPQIRDARRGRALERLRTFLRAYGGGEVDPARFVEAVQQNQEWFGRLIERYIAAGHAGFADYLAAERRMTAGDYRRWLQDEAVALQDALTT
jgi:Ser/Thr protein kinase RdoA (MazF antagonist)